MDLVEILKIVMAVFIAFIFLVIIVKSWNPEQPFKAFMILIVEVAVGVVVILLSSWAVDNSFKKAVLTQFSNRFIHSQEKLSIKGCVRNVGKYPINNVYLHIKVINNASGGSVQNNSSGRSNTLERSDKVVTHLSRGAQKCFVVSFKYPPYFKLANIQKQISWD